MRARLCLLVAVLAVTSCGGDAAPGAVTTPATPSGSGTASPSDGADITEPGTTEPGTSAPSSTTTTEVVTGEVTVLTSRWMESYGVFKVDVLVANNTNITVGTVRLTVDLLDAGGAVVATAEPNSSTITLPVASGEVVPYSAFVYAAAMPPGAAAAVADARVAVAGWERPVIEYLPVEVGSVVVSTGSRGSGTSSGADVGLANGEMRNPTATALSVGLISTAVLGSDGLPLLDQPIVSPEFARSIAAGDTQPFRLIGVPIGIAPEALRVTVWATAAIGLGDLSALEIEPEFTVFRRADGVVDLVGAVANVSSEAVSITDALLCVIRDADGDVVDVMLARQQAAGVYAPAGFAVAGFSHVAPGETIGFVCSDTLGLSARPGEDFSGYTIDVHQDGPVYPSLADFTEVPFTMADPVVDSGLVSVTITVTSASTELTWMSASLVVRDADGVPVTVGVGFYCLQDPSGCNPNVPPGASVPIDIVADVPTGFDAATMTYDIEARKSPIP